MSNSSDFSDTSASRYSLALYELADEMDQILEIENIIINVEIDAIKKVNELNVIKI